MFHSDSILPTENLSSIFIGGIPAKFTYARLANELHQSLASQGLLLPYQFSLSQDPIRPELNKGYAFLRVKPIHVQQFCGIKIIIGGREIMLSPSNRNQPIANESRPPPDAPNQKRLYLKGLPLNVSDKQLKSLLNYYFPCSSAYSIRDDHGKSKGYGFVILECLEDVPKMLGLGKLDLLGRLVTIVPPSPHRGSIEYYRSQHATKLINLPPLLQSLKPITEQDVLQDTFNYNRSNSKSISSIRPNSFVQFPKTQPSSYQKPLPQSNQVKNPDTLQYESHSVKEARKHPAFRMGGKAPTLLRVTPQKTIELFDRLYSPEDLTFRRRGLQG